MKKFLRDNGLTVVLTLIILITVTGHLIAGLLTLNQELAEAGRHQITLSQYVFNGHFIGSFFENWESEFLQMALYVLLTTKLYQRGSAESKDPDKKEEVDRESNPRRKNVPLPVKKGGFWLKLYQNSLSYTFLILFLASLLLHAYGSAKEYNQEQELKGRPVRVTTIEFMGNPEFWYQSFQNWQSEFVAVISIVVFTIFLRQKGSPESKPVDAPHSQTGE